MKPVIAIFFALCPTIMWAQRDLAFYIEEAKANSPLIQENKILREASLLEIERLKALYTKPEISLTGAYLLSPVISRESGKRDVVINPDETQKNYSGYDLAATNGGNYQALLNMNQPLFNGGKFRANAEQSRIGSQINDNTIQATAHDLERIITDQYILCIQDLKQAQYFDTLIGIIHSQKAMVARLAEVGLSKRSDLSLLNIEQKTQEAALNSFRANYRRDLLDLRVLSGVSDTSYQILEEIHLQRHPDVSGSQFTNRFTLDSLNVMATQRIAELKYKPTAGVFANAGLNAVYAPTIPNRFGMSAGLNFAVILIDGKQRKITRQKSEVLIRSSTINKRFFNMQNDLRKQRIVSELKSVSERLVILQDQLVEYKTLLQLYKEQLSLGQISVIDYIMTLKNMVITERDFMLLQSNEQLLINLYNYWNW